MNWIQAEGRSREEAEVERGRWLETGGRKY
jgi:hypothetical protein